jgi:hypothetical protein
MRFLRKATGWQAAAIALLLSGSFSAPAPAFEVAAASGPEWSAPPSTDSLRPVPQTHRISRATAKGAGVRPISSGAAALPGGNGQVVPHFHGPYADAWANAPRAAGAARVPFGRAPPSISSR